MLFNDHVLYLRSKTVAIHRQMSIVLDDYDGQMIPVDECGLNFLTFVLKLGKIPLQIMGGSQGELSEELVT